MLKGYFFILFAAAAWGFIGIFSSLAFSQGISPMEVAFWRALMAGVFFGTQAIAQKQTGFHKKDLPLVALFGLTGVALFYVSFQFAVKTAGAAFAAVLLYTAPAYVVICSFFIYREKISIIKALSVILVITGVFLISKSGQGGGSRSFGLLAVASGLTAGFCYSLYYTIGKYFSGKYSSANLFLWALPIGALGILPFVEFTHKTPLAWTWLILVSFISTFLANTCYYQSLKYLEAGRASIIATLEPVVAAVFAYLILDEYFSAAGYIGAGLIFAAVFSTMYESRKHRQ